MASQTPPGILYVTMFPHPSLPFPRFHDWYNNEHGPGRLRLPFVANGSRYKATDISDGDAAGTEQLHPWMAIYDITDMAELTSETYTRLRKPPVQSQREREMMAHISVNRRFFDLVSCREKEGYRRLEELRIGEVEGGGDSGSESGNVVVAISYEGQLPEEVENESEFASTQGWLRTRRFRTSYLEKADVVEHLVLYDFAPANGLSSSPAPPKGAKTKRVWSLYYSLGPAPRDLRPLTAEGAEPFTSEEQGKMTFPGPSPHAAVSGGKTSHPAIESYITTKDGAILPYRLEGSTDPAAPLILLSNSILTEWGIWDGFISAFLSFSQHNNEKYRFLRYQQRGRSSAFGAGLQHQQQSITVDVLAEDVITLLDALHVPKAACLIGVSLGGATVLNAALRFPERVAAFTSCDTSAKAPAGNQKAWEGRIAVAEEEGAKAEESGEEIVGAELAEMTVRRWFVEESYDGGEVETRAEAVKGMVARNSLEGFRKSVRALWEYDMSDKLEDLRKGGSGVRGLFVAGSGDGKLPGVMEEMAKKTGFEAECVLIDGAGHLPMVEKPEAFAEAITAFLAESG